MGTSDLCRGDKWGVVTDVTQHENVVQCIVPIDGLDDDQGNRCNVDNLKELPLTGIQVALIATLEPHVQWRDHEGVQQVLAQVQQHAQVET